MDKYGLCAGTEDDADNVYLLAFSENSDWVTISCDDYESGDQKVSLDTGMFADALNTCCINISVVDSDFAMLEMHNQTVKITDKVTVGDASGYFGDDYPKGTRSEWEPFLKSGSTWEQLYEVWRGTYVYAEEGLIDMAPMLGMDQNNIATDYHNKVADNKKIFNLYLRKKKRNIVCNNKSTDEKKITLNAAFKKVFGQALEPLGFIRIKTGYPYYVRLIGKEIIHVISFCKDSSNSIYIVGGVNTIYNNDINLSVNPFTVLWLKDINDFIRYSKPYIDDDSKKLIHMLSEIRYKPNNNESILEAFNFALEYTKKIVIPVLDNVTDIESVIEYAYKYSNSNIFFEDSDFSPDSYSYGLLEVLYGDYNKIIEKKYFYKYKPQLDNLKYKIEQGNSEIEQYYNKRCEDIIIEKKEMKAEYLKNMNNKDWRQKALVELERRKSVNTDILRSYGLSI